MDGHNPSSISPSASSSPIDIPNAANTPKHKKKRASTTVDFGTIPQGTAPLERYRRAIDPSSVAPPANTFIRSAVLAAPPPPAQPGWTSSRSQERTTTSSPMSSNLFQRRPLLLNNRIPPQSTISLGLQQPNQAQPLLPTRSQPQQQQVQVQVQATISSNTSSAMAVDKTEEESGEDEAVVAEDQTA